jgi:TPP-dependent 2-oxoacid decarboxylase
LFDCNACAVTQATVATYLIERLKEAGLRHAFGVPGDYVLTFMDRLIEGGIELIGTCNELNAGYAADAYAASKAPAASVSRGASAASAP